MSRTLYTLPILLLVTFSLACDKPKQVAAKVDAKAVKSTPKVAAKKDTTKANPKTIKRKVIPKSDIKIVDTAQKDAKKDDKNTGILGIGSTPANIKDGETNVYGARFTIIEEPITLASAIGKADKSQGPYKVKAKVEKVCQKKGCWFTLKSDGVKIPIRVKMKGYAFFVPTNAMGLDAVLEGNFKKTQISQKEAQHYEDDAAEGTGKPAKKVTGPQDTYMFIATAVQISKKKS